VVRIPEGGLVFSPDGKAATLEMKNVEAVDQPRWPALDAVGTPALMTFKLIVQATGDEIIYDDPQKQFRVQGRLASAQLEARVELPSTGFWWQSDPLSTSRASFAIVGEEVNGRYYTPKSTT
jgi:hypothetical protein